MDEIIFNDNMKKESKIYLALMILFFTLAILFPIGAILKDFSIKELIIGDILLFSTGCIFLYFFLYAIKYTVTVTKEKIKLKTLFKTVIFNFTDIKNYTCKRYMKSAFYQFTIFYLDKKVLINTRHFEVLDKLLINSKQHD